MPEKMLEITDLEVYYGKLRALDKISLHVNKGEIVALLGANGAGKSTTLLSIAGVTTIGNGSIIYKGQDLKNIKPEKIVTHGIALAPEGRHIYPYLSVLDNLRMGAITINNKKQIADTIEEVYDLFPRLKERETQLAGTMSGGEQQMLTIGRAMMSRPELMLLDEPSLGISPILTEQIFDAIRKINEFGTTILLVEQNTFAAFSLASRAYILETGKIAMSGTSEELSRNQDVRKAYLGC